MARKQAKENLKINLLRKLQIVAVKPRMQVLIQVGCLWKVEPEVPATKLC